MWTAEHWRRIEQLFEAALALPEGERAGYVAAQCGPDAALRSQVERMLVADRVDRGVVDGVAITGDSVDPYLGAQFGNWRLESKIAEGGMGTVYRAVRVDGAFPRPVAVKLLHVGLLSESMRRRFLREPRLLGRIEHKNIARLLDGGATLDGVPYIVMELVDGVRVDRFCDERRLSIRARLQLFETICLAADHAHRSLVLHRDLKPSNILVTGDGEPRLVDFGIAALLEDPDESGERRVTGGTGTNPAAYTPEYASPEQMRGDVVGVASDVWSLGVVLHELLAGVRPFRGEEIRALASDPISSVPLPRLSAQFSGDDAATQRSAAARSSTPARLGRELRGDLDRIVAMALEVDPARRYSSCREFADDIRRHLDGFPVFARPLTAWYRIERFVLRHRVATLLGAALAASLVLGTVVSLSFARNAAIERDAAVAARHLAEAQAKHASIEASSSAMIADSLTDVFLNATFFEQPGLKDRVRERILEQAATIRVKHGGDPHLRANLIDALGTAARHVGLSDDAKLLTVEALETRTEFFGRDHLERALSLGNLGALELELGNATDARVALEEALNIHQRHSTEVHADVGRAMNDFAVACAACGDFQRAYEVHRGALAIREREEPDSLAVAESHNNLAAALLRLGRAKEAKENLDAAYAIRHRVLGDSAYLTLQCLSNRGSIELKTGDLTAARADFETAIDGMRKLRGAGAEALAVLLPRLAQVAIAQDDLEAAQKILDEAIAAAAAQFSKDHPRAADAISQRAALHSRRREYAGAISDWEEVLRIRKNALPPDHPAIAATLHELGLAREDAGDHEHAAEELEASLEIRPDDRAQNAAARCALGTVYSRLGRQADAERELLQARADAGKDDRELRAAIRRGLAVVYRATGREAEAAAVETDED